MTVSQFYFRGIELDFGEGLQLDLRARLAFDLIRQYGIIAATEDGEDGANRSKLRLQTPEEVVARCFSMAEIVVATCEERGYLKPITITRDDLDREEAERSDRRYTLMAERAAAAREAERKHNSEPT